jgi:hypothetical protein
MPAHSITPTHWFRIVLVATFVLAWFSWTVPGRRMPIDTHAIFWWSIPLASSWVLTVGVAVQRFRKKALWMFFGAPMALYWPVWLALHGIPGCYRQGNCI